MKISAPETITKYFSSLTDPRILKKTAHKLIDIIVVTICAVICGADGWTEVEEYGKAKYEWLKGFLELPSGSPSHDTFGRVFSILNPKEFEICFLNWVRSVFKLTQGRVVAVDGKTLRRSYDHSSNKAAIHMVSAWACENRIALGQIKTDEKSNEITAIPELLDILVLEGCIVTIDAMGCQKDIAEKIIDKGADYALALKGNHGNLNKHVSMFFEDAIKNGFKDINVSYDETVEKDHGRIEIRRYWTIENIDWLQGKENWKNLSMIGMVESERHIEDKISIEKRYYISSMKSNAKEFGKVVRGHWGIENGLHWVLDVAFREDESRIRKGYASENLAVIRHIALNLLRREKTKKVGVGVKRMKAGWDNKYLLKVLKT